MSKEKTKYFGAMMPKIDVRDYRMVAGSISNQILEEEFTLNMPKVKNQGRISSCCANALAVVVEYFNKTQNNDKTEMSVGYIYGNRLDSAYKGSGMYLRDAIAAVCTYGDVYKKTFPHNEETPSIIEKFEAEYPSLKEVGKPNKLTSYYKLCRINEIKESLVKNGPVLFAMKWYDDLEVVDGVMRTSQSGQISGYHCMLIYGWNKDGWKIMNSWGRTWGNKGTAILPFNVELDEVYGVIDTLTNDTKIKKPFSGVVGNFVAKIINWFLNLFKKA